MGRGEAEAALLEGAPRRADSEPLSAPDARQPELVEGTPFTEAELDRYSERLIEMAGAEAGDTIALELYNPEQLDAVRGVSSRAFARQVAVEVVIPPIAGSGQVSALLERGASFLSLSTTVSSRGSSDALSELTEAATAAGFSAAVSRANAIAAPGPDAWAAYREAKAENQIKWGVALWPSREWAEEVYPELDSDSAYRQLGLDLLEFTRASTADSSESWTEHATALERRARALSELEIDHLEISTEAGTSLRMEIASGSAFRTCEMKTAGGERFLVNCPTEEVFATPRAASVSGVLRATRPLVVGGGGRIEGIEITMESGEISAISFERAYDASGEFPRASVERWLAQEFSAAKGMNRVGELGLVDRSSRIARSGRVYMNTLLDENAGLHLGFGNSYDQFTGGEGNSASDHVDLCIGSPDQEVTAVTTSGERVAVIEKGLWQI